MQKIKIPPAASNNIGTNFSATVKGVAMPRLTNIAFDKTDTLIRATMDNINTYIIPFLKLEIKIMIKPFYQIIIHSSANLPSKTAYCIATLKTTNYKFKAWQLFYIKN